MRTGQRLRHIKAVCTQRKGCKAQIAERIATKQSRKHPDVAENLIRQFSCNRMTNDRPHPRRRRGFTINKWGKTKTDNLSLRICGHKLLSGRERSGKKHIVTIKVEEPVAGRNLKTRIPCTSLAAIGLVHNAHTRVARGPFVQRFTCSVRRTVIDANTLKGTRVAFCGRADTVQGRLDIRPKIEERYDNGNLHIFIRLRNDFLILPFIYPNHVVAPKRAYFSRRFRAAKDFRSADVR